MSILRYPYICTLHTSCIHCLSGIHLQALKHLRTAQFCPLVVFIKASSVDCVRRLHRSARVDNQGGSSGLDVSHTLHFYHLLHSHIPHYHHLLHPHSYYIHSLPSSHF